jgi:hypothetical protein
MNAGFSASSQPGAKLGKMGRFTSAISATLAFLLVGGAANAEGVTRIQQSDGATHVYQHVNIQLAGRTLRLRSGDHRGVLEVTSGACSFKGEIERCLPFTTTLRQHGKTHQIKLENGTVYLNLTDGALNLPHSSEQLGPHGVVVLLHTVHGTLVSVKGTLDQVK